MWGKPARQSPSWALYTVLAINLALAAGCASKASTSRHAASAVGSNCYAKALPTSGEGGLAWGDSMSIARQKSLNNCMRYASRSGGTPHTCQVVLAKCKR